MKKFFYFIITVLVICGVIFIYQNISRHFNENRMLKQIILALQADSRIAEVLVTDVHYDEKIKKSFTTIKFLEYDTKQHPFEPKYFTFPGNIIQFQSLVIRFDDLYIKSKDLLKGKSAYLFWKVFMLDGADTKEFEITKVSDVPQGYKIQGPENDFEKGLWEKFWIYALDPKQAAKMGIKNVQIEAPGTMFVPGTIYTIKIEHDGGMRIDAAALPNILKGEEIPKK